MRSIPDFGIILPIRQARHNRFYTVPFQFCERRCRPTGTVVPVERIKTGTTVPVYRNGGAGQTFIVYCFKTILIYMILMIYHHRAAGRASQAAFHGAGAGLPGMRLSAHCLFRITVPLVTPFYRGAGGECG